MKPKIPFFSSVEISGIHSLILQKILSANFKVLTNNFIENSCENLSCKIEGLDFDFWISEGKISIKSKIRYLFLICKFLLTSLGIGLLVIPYIIRGCFRKHNRRVVLCYGFPFDRLSVDEYGEIIEMLCETFSLQSKYIYIEAVPSDTKEVRSRFICFRRYIILEAVKGSAFNLIDLWDLGVLIVSSMMGFLCLVFNTPEAIVLWKDFIWKPLVSLLARKKIIDAVFDTNSNFVNQRFPLVSMENRSFRYIMLWYSLNILPFALKRESNADVIEFFSLSQFILADIHITWNDLHEYLINKWTGKNNFLRNPPILFEKKQQDEIVLDTSKFNIVIYDVIPVNSAWLQSNPLIFYYYTLDNMLSFMRDVLDCVKKDTRVELYIKPKRLNHTIYDQSYTQYIEDICSKGYVTMLPVETGIESLCHSMDLAITVPFSSPGFAHNIIANNGCFYDPSGALQKLSSRLPLGDTPILFGRKSLFTYIDCQISSYFARM